MRSVEPPLAVPARSLVLLLQRQATERPQAPALSVGGPGAGAAGRASAALSYAELAVSAETLAMHLRQAFGVQAGDRVAWLGLNHPVLLQLLFALARLGAVLVPLNHRLADAEWRSVLADCTPVLLLHDALFESAARSLVGAGPGGSNSGSDDGSNSGSVFGISGSVSGTGQGLRTLAMPEIWQAMKPVIQPGLDSVGADLAAPGGADPALAPATAVPSAIAIETAPPDETAAAFESPVLLVYTSGTTGVPKAALHTQGNLLANMAMAAQVQRLTADDTVLTVLPLFHVGGLCIQTLPALSVGAHVVLHTRFDAGSVLQAIATDRPSLTLQVPATLQALTEHPLWPATELGSLRAVWAGSSVLPPAPLAAFHARGVPVCNVYGSTETGPFSIALSPEQAVSHAGSCGWPAPGVEVVLRTPAGEPVAPGAVGEICLRAPNVVRHYWPDRPACDAEGFFHSGDLAQQAADGSYNVVGRVKDMIISGGENIYPAEIENLLLQHPMVLECSVVGQADARWGEVAVAVLVLQPGAPPGDGWAEPLRAFLDGRLARYKWPRRWQRLDALPRTALGKVQKSALKTLLDGETPGA